MSIKLVTGNTLETNVEASDDRALHAGIVGTGDYVFRVGQRFAHQVIGNRTVRIFDGEGIMQGAHFIIPYGKYDDIEIDSSIEGYKRIDLICARYYKYQNSETVELVVVKGLEVSGSPEVPEVTVGSILEDTPEHNMPLKKVTVQGSAIVSVEDVFAEIPTISELHDPSWIPLELMSGAVAAPDYATRAIPSYRKIGNRVQIQGAISCTIPKSDAFKCAELPKAYCPKGPAYGPSVCAGNRLVRLLVGASGGIYIEWIYDFAERSQFSGHIPWVVINIEYDID